MKISFDVELTSNTCMVNGVACSLYGPTAMQGLGQVLKEYLFKAALEDGVYNKGLYWPEELQFAVACAMRKYYRIEGTNHLFERLYQYHLPRGCYKAMLYGEVIEAEVRDGIVYKVVTRLPNRWNSDEDLCAAIVFAKNEFGEHIARVVTMWCNDHWDTHFTLKKENYVSANR